jgi:hypothetical protein
MAVGLALGVFKMNMITPAASYDSPTLTNELTKLHDLMTTNPFVLSSSIDTRPRFMQLLNTRHLRLQAATGVKHAFVPVTALSSLLHMERPAFIFFFVSKFSSSKIASSGLHIPR